MQLLILLKLSWFFVVELALGRSTYVGLTGRPAHQTNVSDSVCQLQQPTSLETRIADGEKLSDSVRQKVTSCGSLPRRCVSPPAAGGPRPAPPAVMEFRAAQWARNIAEKLLIIEPGRGAPGDSIKRAGSGRAAGPDVAGWTLTVTLGGLVSRQSRCSRLLAGYARRHDRPSDVLWDAMVFRTAPRHFVP